MFDDCRVVYFLTPMPMVFFAEGTNMLFARHTDDLYGMWSATNHKPELIKALELLYDWRNAFFMERELVVVSGDVHEGGYSDLLDMRWKGEKNDKALMKQITTSAISNKPTKRIEHMGLKCLRDALLHIDKKFYFKHYNWTNGRNFCIVSSYLDPSTQEHPNGIIRYSSRLYTADPSRKVAKNPVSNTFRTSGLGRSGWANCCSCCFPGGGNDNCCGCC
eukprot:Trichotokara_eunicae@DN6022_c0_g1_i4.p1